MRSRKISFPKAFFRIAPSPPGLARIPALTATCFGIGRLRPAPGTLGSLAAIAPGYMIALAGGLPALALASLVVLILGAWAAERYGKASGQADDSSIVIDEVAGLWIAALPAATVPGLWLAAFVLFRFFDIYKPWPASYFDRKKRGGWDIMLDDVVAGIFALMGVASLSLLFT